jgi:D-tyrosyl-tRNA(Tyr) deacylase
VTVEEITCGSIGPGLLILLGVAKTDTTRDADYLAAKIAALRIFNDPQGKMNLSLIDVNGAALVVSNFTLYADCRKGNRPSFDLSAPAGQARALYEYFVESLRSKSIRVETGVFQAHMQVHLENDGPVTVILESV